ncbi:MAG: nucleotide pyrophosphatase, partial [Candidatus Hydrogenedentes bacterium]|nr:nucleotide pyrophosphatase [Candidatus Hydrogenedentota bacterium]
MIRRGSSAAMVVAACVGAVALNGFAQESLASRGGVKHVVVVGVDGMSPAGIAAANTPHLDALMARGAFT